MTEVFSLHFGAVFKHAFSQPDIFREFVRDVAGVDINPKMIHTEYEYAERVGNVNIKYDIFAEDKKEFEIGIQRGLKQVLEERRERAIQNGRRQQQEETANVLLTNGLEHSIITRVTGLTVDEVESLV